jgi:hypothetical protein|tara:strand:+ start:41 stop:175 length:135 start_codon:yes stop_codon:yes gene_type:complete
MLANILQISGAVLISVGAAIVWPPAGLVLAGISSIIFGIALERK